MEASDGDIDEQLINDRHNESMGIRNQPRYILRKRESSG